jgi:hypothetical protein
LSRLDGHGLQEKGNISPGKVAVVEAELTQGFGLLVVE